VFNCPAYDRDEAMAPIMAVQLLISIWIWELMGTIKDRNSKDLTEAEEIKKRWQEYTELYKNGFNDPHNHDGVVTHLDPDILEYEVVGFRKHYYE